MNYSSLKTLVADNVFFFFFFFLFLVLIRWDELARLPGQLAKLASPPNDDKLTEENHVITWQWASPFTGLAWFKPTVAAR